MLRGLTDFLTHAQIPQNQSPSSKTHYSKSHGAQEEQSLGTHTPNSLCKCLHNLCELLQTARRKKQLKILLRAIPVFPEHRGSGSADGRRAAAFPEVSGARWDARSPPRACLAAPARQARPLSCRRGQARRRRTPARLHRQPVGSTTWTRTSTARTAPAAGAWGQAGKLHTRMWKNLATANISSR